MDDYTKEVIEKYTELKRAAQAVELAQQLLDVNQEADAGYVLFRLERKYLNGYMTAWNSLKSLLPLSPTDNADTRPNLPF